MTGNDKDQIRPQNITVKLLANGIDMGKSIVLEQRKQLVGEYSPI